jgi:hypothetical protein
MNKTKMTAKEIAAIKAGENPGVSGVTPVTSRKSMPVSEKYADEREEKQ